jgi:hypothetical protein
VAALKDSRALALTDGKFAAFDSVVDYRDFYNDRDAWPDVTDPAEISAFVAAARKPLKDMNARPVNLERASEGNFRVGRVFERTPSVYLPNFLNFTFVTLIASVPLLVFTNPADSEPIVPYASVSPAFVVGGIFLWLVLRLFGQAKGHRWAVFGIVVLTNVGSSIVSKVIEVIFTAIGGGTLALIGFLVGNAIWEAFFAVFVVVTARVQAAFHVNLLAFEEVVGEVLGLPEDHVMPIRFLFPFSRLFVFPAPAGGDGTRFTNDTSYTVTFTGSTAQMHSNVFNGHAGVVALPGVGAPFHRKFLGTVIAIFGVLKEIFLSSINSYFYFSFPDIFHYV